MSRLPVERGDNSSEPPQRPTSPLRGSRWTDKVFVIPEAVADVIAKMNQSFFGPTASPPVEQPSTPRRRRGFYVWTPTLRSDGKPYAMGGVVRLIEEVDPRTGEIITPRKKDVS
jgi:hypothetical protein